MAHSRAAVDHPAGTFDAAQLEMLRADPQLLVEELAPAPATPPASPISALPANGVDAPALRQGEALTEAAKAADQTDANAGDQAVAGTHAEGEGAPGGEQPPADAAGGDAPPAEAQAAETPAPAKPRPRGKG